MLLLDAIEVGTPTALAMPRYDPVAFGLHARNVALDGANRKSGECSEAGLGRVYGVSVVLMANNCESDKFLSGS